ncbi:unnamed protein product [Thelazia callipaeda]|uniref:Transmembrane protein 234 homolog n=1 Tax=Thelazia callipaeda TaxID=103827 RepID=A0A0N5CVN4_THECL|nr:unnamed protein product [Thelazia callipaeda]
MAILSEYIGAVFVAFLWGTTNPLIRQAACSRTQSRDIAGNYYGKRLIWQLWEIIRYWPFSIPFAVNQIASLLYMWVLTKLPVTVAVPLVNSLTFVFTELTGRMLGEKGNHTVIIGAILIVIGAAITVLAD